MAFFDDIGKKISQTSQDAVKKTKEMAEVAKLNSQISSEEKNIDALYLQLGQAYYNNSGKGVEKKAVDAAAVRPEDQFAAICVQISDSFAKIESIKEEIRNIKAVEPQQDAQPMTNSKFCSSCGAAITEGSGFCPSCGQKQ